jgi:hypothetical protein
MSRSRSRQIWPCLALPILLAPLIGQWFGYGWLRRPKRRPFLLDALLTLLLGSTRRSA